MISILFQVIIKYLKKVLTSYTVQTGLLYFDRAADTATGNWYYDSALESMGTKPCFRCHSVNIALIYIQ